MILNWQNDPFLLDAKPTPINDWLTANKLLAKESQKENSNDNSDLTSLKGEWFVPCNDNVWSLNLYSILVRKIDFVRVKDSDRILSRFPFLVLRLEEKEWIKKVITGVEGENGLRNFAEKDRKEILGYRKNKRNGDRVGICKTS